jgi:hypothetical protein
MIKSTQNARFVLKSLEAIQVAGKSSRKNLEGDDAIEMCAR